MKKEKRIIFGIVVVLLAGVIIINNLLNRPAKYNSRFGDKFTVKFSAPQSGGINIDTSANTPQTLGASDDLELFFSPSVPEIRLINNKTGFVWSSMPNSLATQSNTLGQLCSVVYINTDSDNTGTINNISDECSLSYSSLNNGIAIDFEFPTQGLKFTLQIWLQNGRMWSRIPLAGIVETDPYKFLSIDMLPYFGAVGTVEDGYILFPDGMGALYPLNSTSGSSPQTLDIYSNRIMDIDSLVDNSDKAIHNAMLPVYGMKNGENSFVAFIADGAESSAVTLEPNGYVLKLSRVYSSCIYRKVTEVISDSDISSFQADRDIGTGDYSVCYMFQSGENSDYSGMAASVRKLMSENRLLPKSEMKKTSLKLDVMMGAVEGTMVGNRYRTVTNVKQLKEILNDFSESKNGVTAVLLGWDEKGYGIYPTNAKASSKIGNLSSLKLKNSEVYLEYQTTLAKNSEKAASSRRDAIRNNKMITILNADKDYYIMNANSQYLLFKNSMKRLFKADLSGISLSGAGSIIYDDYNKLSPMTRLQTKNSYAAIMDTAGEKGNLIVRKANAYSLKYADWLADLPENSSGYSILREEVPFYYLLVSGKVPYSTENAGNLVADFRKTKLKWIEYGAIPYFIISNDGSEKLSNTPAKKFFSIKYSEQKRQISETVKEFDDLRNQLGGATLVKHEKISNGVFRSDFENGAYVITNYNDTDFSFNGKTVSAKGYLALGVGE